MAERMRWLGLAVLALSFTGCVRESTNGDEHVFRYELWVPALIFLGGVVAAPVGWVKRGSWSRTGWALLILGPVAALGFAPSMLMDRVVVKSDGFSRHSGIWGMTSVQDVKFADVSHMQLTTREERGRRGRRVERTYLICQLGGDAVEVPVNNDVTRAAMPELLKAAGAAGIMIAGPGAM